MAIDGDGLCWNMEERSEGGCNELNSLFSSPQVKSEIGKLSNQHQLLILKKHQKEYKRNSKKNEHSCIYIYRGIEET